jgi:hypothetical protein
MRMFFEWPIGSSSVISPPMIRSVCKVLNPIICEVPIPGEEGELYHAEEFARRCDIYYFNVW